jgi:hypothetical protein
MNPQLQAQAGFDEADRTLAEGVRHLVFQDSGDVRESDPSHEARLESVSRFHELLSALRRLVSPRPVRIGIGFAVGLILAVAITQIRTPTREKPGPIVFRGSEPSSLTASNPERMPDSMIKFSWSAVEDADHYQLIIMDGHRNELIRFDAGTEATISVDPASIPGFGEPGAVHLWRIVAIQEGDEIARSGLRSLVLRSP